MAGHSGASVWGDLSIKLKKDPDRLQMFTLIKVTYLHSQYIDGVMD